MIARARVALLLLRPPVAVLLALFASVALARAHASGQFVATAVTAVVIGGYLLFSVAVNDIADAAIDRINLAGDRRRPLVTDASPRRDLAIIGGIAALAAVIVSAAVDVPLLITTTVGLALSAAYSVRPIRLADRGAVAALMLPACYVAVPYLAAIFAANRTPAPSDLFVLAGLYAGFLGRIVLKDFRDVRGDALFGKRTFLVRHGRRATCLFSATSWTIGTLLLALATRQTAFGLTAGLGTAAAVVLLRRLSTEANLRREQWTISALSILGRGMMIGLLADFEMVQRAWSTMAISAVLGTIALLTAGQAALMLRIGPRGRSIDGARDCAERATHEPMPGVYSVTSNRG